MSRYILVLARSPHAAATYAARKEWRPGQYRAVSSASSIRGIQVADVHILPGFHDRQDSHAILAQLRWGRDIVKMDVEMPPLEEIVEDQGDGMGPQMTIFDALEQPYTDPERLKSLQDSVNTMVEHLSEVVVEKVGESADLEIAKIEAPKSPKAKRSRCRTCGVMVTGPTDPKHLATAHPSEFES